MANPTADAMADPDLMTDPFNMYPFNMYPFKRVNTMTFAEVCKSYHGTVSTERNVMDGTRSTTLGSCILEKEKCQIMPGGTVDDKTGKCVVDPIAFAPLDCAIKNYKHSALGGCTFSASFGSYASNDKGIDIDRATCDCPTFVAHLTNDLDI